MIFSSFDLILWKPKEIITWFLVRIRIIKKKVGDEPHQKKIKLNSPQSNPNYQVIKNQLKSLLRTLDCISNYTVAWDYNKGQR